MIRKETLTTFDSWTPPTPEEVTEMFHLCAPNNNQLAKMLGITPTTLRRWIVNGIAYADWAFLALLAGKGDIVRPSETVEDIEAKLETIARVSFVYHRKIRQIQEEDERKKRISQACDAKKKAKKKK